MGRDHLDRSPAFVSVRQLLITISQLCLCESLINGYCVVLEHVSFLGSNATYFLRSFVASSVCACLSVRVCVCVLVYGHTREYPRVTRTVCSVKDKVRDATGLMTSQDLGTYIG